MSNRVDKPLRVLVVRVGAMGDVLHAVPAVTALRHALPDAYIGWAVEPRWAALLQASGGDASAMPLVDRVHLVETRAWSQHPFSPTTLQSVLALRAQLRAERYDVAIDLQGSVRSAVIARMSGAARVVGSATPRERPARWLYGASAYTAQPHVLQQAAEIVSFALSRQLDTHESLVAMDAAAEAWANARVRDDGRPLVLLAPTAGWGAKMWPVENFAQVARALAAAGCRVLVNASNDEDAVAAEVVHAAAGTAEAVVCSVAQLASLLRRSALMIAGDTGPLHLAAALRVPVVALFGPTDPARTGPWGVPAVVLRNALSATDHRRHTRTEAGLASVESVDVIAAARQLLAR